VQVAVGYTAVFFGISISVGRDISGTGLLDVGIDTGIGSHRQKRLGQPLRDEKLWFGSGQSIRSSSPQT